MFRKKSIDIKIVNKDAVFVENESKLLAAFLPMIESLFLPGKGSSESSEKGKKGKSQIIFRLIQVKSHTCMILTQESKDKQITFNITQNVPPVYRIQAQEECQIKQNQLRVGFCFHVMGKFY